MYIYIGLAINNYDNASILRGSVNSVLALGDYFKQRYPEKEYGEKFLLEKECSRANILEKLGYLKDLGSDNTVIIYYSGHAHSDRWKLLGKDIILYSELFQVLKRVKCRIWFLNDCCYAYNLTNYPIKFNYLCSSVHSQSSYEFQLPDSDLWYSYFYYVLQKILNNNFENQAIYPHRVLAAFQKFSSTIDEYQSPCFIPYDDYPLIPHVIGKYRCIEDIREDIIEEAPEPIDIGRKTMRYSEQEEYVYYLYEKYRKIKIKKGLKIYDTKGGLIHV